MKVSEYRKVIDALSRFATTREKATGPESRVGVQVNDGVVKLVSGSDTAGLIYTLDPVDYEVTSGRYGYTIDARPLIESAKILPAKDTISIKVDKDSFSITASGGGRLELKAVAPLSEAGFPKKPKQPVATASVYGEQWGQMSRLVMDIADKVERPTLHYIPSDVAYITIVSPGMRAKYANMKTTAIGGPDEYSVVTELDFWSGIRAMSSDGTIAFGPDGVLAKTPMIECFSTLVIADEEFFWPVLGYGGGSVSFDIDRQVLIGAVKAQAPNDEHNRVTFLVKDGTLLVTAFGNEEGLTVPAKTEGEGVRSVNAGYLRELLSAMTDSKSVTLKWGNPAPAISISAREYPAWTVLIAPVALR